MNLLGKTFLRVSAWDEFSRECARKIPHDNPTGHVDDLLHQVEKGRYSLLKVVRESDGEPVGIVVFDVEESDGKELLIVATYAREAGIDLTAVHLPEVERIAVGLGCKSVRFHTIRPGLVKKADELGYRVSEVILRKNVVQ